MRHAPPRPHVRARAHPHPAAEGLTRNDTLVGVPDEDSHDIVCRQDVPAHSRARARASPPPRGPGPGAATRRAAGPSCDTGANPSSTAGNGAVSLRRAPVPRGRARASIPPRQDGAGSRKLRVPVPAHGMGAKKIHESAQGVRGQRVERVKTLLRKESARKKFSRASADPEVNPGHPTGIPAFTRAFVATVRSVGAGPAPTRHYGEMITMAFE